MIYSIIVGDLFTDLAAAAGVSSLIGIPLTRPVILLLTHAFGLLPLCLLRFGRDREPPGSSWARPGRDRGGSGATGRDQGAIGIDCGEIGRDRERLTES